MFSITIFIACLLFFIINFINIITISSQFIVNKFGNNYGASQSFFNLFGLISQFGVTLMNPLIARSIEKRINLGYQVLIYDFRFIIFSGTLGAILGALFIPTTIVNAKLGVNNLIKNNSLLFFFNKIYIYSVLKNFIFIKPRILFYFFIFKYKKIYNNIYFINFIVFSFTNISVLTCLYAGFLYPNVRSTAQALSGLNIGLASAGFLLIIQPFGSLLLDKKINSKISDFEFKEYYFMLIIIRILASLFSQIIFVPISYSIAYIANYINLI